MSWLIIFILVCLLLGFVAGITGMKSLRSRPHPQAEVAWKQNPLSAWKYGMLSMIAIAIHTLGLLGLTVILQWNVMQSKVLLFPQGLGRPAVFIPALAAVFFTAQISGAAIAFHLARQWIRPISYGISRDGIFFGGHLMSWKSYSHYEIGPDDGQVSLHSSYSPPLRTLVFQPPPESFPEVLGLIQKNLSPALTIDDSSSWLHSPLTLILGMVVLVLGALLPGIRGLWQNQSWVWIYALVAFFLVNILGNRLMTIYDGRGKYPEEKIKTTQGIN